MRFYFGGRGKPKEWRRKAAIVKYLVDSVVEEKTAKTERGTKEIPIIMRDSNYID